MEFTGVYHKTSEQMSYPYNENQLIVNIKTGYDVKRSSYIMETRLMQVFWAEKKSGLETGRNLLQKAAEASALVDNHPCAAV